MEIKNIDFRQKIQSNYHSFGTKKRRIADFILANPQKTVSLSVQELASLCECEQTTIVRFAQQLGFSGYTALKIAIARQSDAVWEELPAQDEKNIHPVLGKLLRRHQSSLQATLEESDPEELEKIAEILSRADRVLTFGAGTSHLAAMDLNIKLLRLGVQSNCFGDAEMSKTFLGYAAGNGMIFLFSHSGETATVLELAKLAKQENITLAAITGNPDSTLAKCADHLLLTRSCPEPPIRIGMMSARLAQLVMVDAITVFFSIFDKDRSWNFIAKGYHENE